VTAGKLQAATWGSSWRPSWEALAACIVFVACAVGITAVWEHLGDAVTDVALYQAYGERIADGLVPYRDFGFEYPPGALPAIVLPALVTGSLHAYRVAFVAEMAIVGVLGVLVLDATLRRLELPRRERVLSLAVVALTPLLLGGVILTRFDLVPAALVVVAVALAVAGRRRAAALMVGIGTAVKLYPALLLPPLAIDAWRRGGRRELAIVLGLAATPIVLAYLAFLVVAPEGVLDSLGRQVGRPLQIESLGAGVLLVLHGAVGTGLGWASGSGSQNLTGAGAGTLAVLQGVAQVAAVTLVWVSYARGPSTAQRLVRHAAASVVAFVALSKVLSPQFLVWLVLLVPLVGGPRRRAAIALTVVACALTAIWFPARYWELVREFDPLDSWLVLLRGLVLLGLLAALTWPATERAPARSPTPVPSPGRT
jgi:glycosyl transferase family 87